MNNETKHRSPSEIAGDIVAEMQSQQPKVWRQRFFASVPYLDAMLDLHDWNQLCMCEPARTIGIYCLGNLNTFRGPEAKRLKEELRAALGVSL